MTTVLILPGYANSGIGHWQTEWERVHAGCVRVQQASWDHPDCMDWCEQLEWAVAEHGENVVLAAHSLGCLLTVYWAERTQQHIKGALLVAPPDPEAAAFPATAHAFSPAVTRVLPFPSIMVASSNDTYGSLDYATRCAHAWGSRMVNVGACGHINADSGLGVWSTGWDMLADWLE